MSLKPILAGHLVQVPATISGVLNLKGSTNCSANPNYPSATKGDMYYVSVAGKIGGASGTAVNVGDSYTASADNAGGTQASVGTSWFVLVATLPGWGEIDGTLSDQTDLQSALDAKLTTSGSNLTSIATRSYSDLQNIPTTNLVYVDGTNGSNSTGAVHRADKPFLTLAAAVSASSSGDTIVVLPGTYTPSANLAKNGVNWFFYAGATISASGNFDLFTDAGGATSYTISGSGKINLTGHGSCFIISNASSVVHIWASEVNQVSGSNPLGPAEGGFYQTAGEFHIKADKISGTVSAAYWDSGICYVEADLLLGNGSLANAIYSQAAAAGQHMHVDAKEIKNTGGSGIQVMSLDGSPTSAFWITTQKVIGYDYLIRRAGPKLYLNTQKLEATTTTTDIGMISSEGGGFLYLTVQKVEALASSSASTSLFYLRDSDSYIDILQLVCSGVTDGVTITDNSSTVTLGNHFLKVGRIDTKGNGIVFTSDTGSASFVGTDITSGATKKDITQSGDGLLLVRACSYDTSKTTGTITQGDPTFASYQPLDSDLTSWAGVTRASGLDTFVATPSSANLKSLVTDETGSGALVFATSPTLVTPILGTPASGTLTNCTFPGTTAGGNATAGNVGEYISASVVVGSATALTSATPKTVTSISLTAGDWDVTAIGALTGASTGTEFDVAIGTTTNSMTGTVLGDTRCQTPTVSLAGADATLMIPAVRVSISSTTTYYLIVQETFTIGTPAAYGRISARRVR